ncbi:hypothetical protein BH23BAC1_BH23BAC1_41900 [soil metagenome]
MIVSKIKFSNKDIENYLGGQFSFFESLKRGGVGSIKLLYVAGIKEFDKIAENNPAMNYCNFQLYKNGMAVLFHKKGEGFVAGIHYGEIEIIKFFSIPIKIRSNFKVKVKYQAELEIHVQDSQVKLLVPVINYKPLKLFLHKNINPQLLDFQGQIP